MRGREERCQQSLVVRVASAAPAVAAMPAIIMSEGWEGSPAASRMARSRPVSLAAGSSSGRTPSVPAKASKRA